MWLFFKCHEYKKKDSTCQELYQEKKWQTQFSPTVAIGEIGDTFSPGEITIMISLPDRRRESPNRLTGRTLGGILHTASAMALNNKGSLP